MAGFLRLFILILCLCTARSVFAGVLGHRTVEASRDEKEAGVVRLIDEVIEYTRENTVEFDFERGADAQKLADNFQRMTMLGKKGYHELMANRYAELLAQEQVWQQLPMVKGVDVTCENLAAVIEHELSAKVFQLAVEEAFCEFILEHLVQNAVSIMRTQLTRAPVDEELRQKNLFDVFHIANVTLVLLEEHLFEHVPMSLLYWSENACLHECQLALNDATPRPLIAKLLELANHQNYATPAAMSGSVAAFYEQYSYMRYLSNPWLGIHYLRRGYFGYGSVERRFQLLITLINRMYDIVYAIYLLITGKEFGAPYSPTPEMYTAPQTAKSLAEKLFANNLQPFEGLALFKKILHSQHVKFAKMINQYDGHISVSLSPRYMDNLCNSVNRTLSNRQQSSSDLKFDEAYMFEADLTDSVYFKATPGPSSMSKYRQLLTSGFDKLKLKSRVLEAGPGKVAGFLTSNPDGQASVSVRVNIESLYSFLWNYVIFLFHEPLGLFGREVEPLELLSKLLSVSNSRESGLESAGSRLTTTRTPRLMGSNLQRFRDMVNYNHSSSDSAESEEEYFKES